MTQTLTDLEATLALALAAKALCEKQPVGDTDRWAIRKDFDSVAELLDAKAAELKSEAAYRWRLMATGERRAAVRAAVELIFGCEDDQDEPEPTPTVTFADSVAYWAGEEGSTIVLWCSGLMYGATLCMSDIDCPDQRYTTLEAPTAAGLLHAVADEAARQDTIDPGCGSEMLADRPVRVVHAAWPADIWAMIEGGIGEGCIL